MSRSVSQRLAVFTPKQLRELLDMQHKVVIVDVRAAEKFAASHVEGAINIPAHKLAAEIGEFTKETTVVTVCNLGGTRSCNTADELRAIGYEKAAALQGGTRGWFEDSATQKVERGDAIEKGK